MKVAKDRGPRVATICHHIIILMYQLYGRLCVDLPLVHVSLLLDRKINYHVLNITKTIITVAVTLQINTQLRTSHMPLIKQSTMICFPFYNIGTGCQGNIHMVAPIWGSLCLALKLDGTTSSDVAMNRVFPSTVPLYLGMTPLRVAEDRRALLTSFSLGGGLGSRRRNHACRSACGGVIRVAGSQSRQRFMKSRNRGSSQPLRAVTSSLVAGGPRCFPRRERPPVSWIWPSGPAETLQ